jgi:vacuolar-type H+-ATPase subunit E/Vma4
MRRLLPHQKPRVIGGIVVETQKGAVRVDYNGPAERFETLALEAIRRITDEG